MFRIFPIVGALCLLFPSSLFSQNLLPNPGFEAYTQCPNSLGDVDNHCVSWFRANSASPDYGNCTFYGYPSVATQPRTGSGVIGMWGGSNHGLCTGSAYSEVIRATLVTPMVSGQSYNFSIAAQIDGVGTATNNPNDCVNLGAYFYNSATPPNTNNYCCVLATPQWEIPGNSLIRGTYQLFSTTITATGNFDRVIIGPFCNPSPTSGGCGTFGTNQEYINIDDVALSPTVILDERSFALSGSAYLDFHQLSWRLPDGMESRQVMIERSTDGKRFTVLAELLPQAGERQFSFRDENPETGDNHYRVTALDLDGHHFSSDLLRLRHGLTESGDEGSLAYHYDNLSGTMTMVLAPDQADTYQLSVFDMAGRLVRSESWHLAAGQQEVQVDFDSFSRGIYALKLQAARSGKVRQNKLVVR